MKLYHIFATEESLTTIPDYPRAKKRRDMTSPLFSRKSVLEREHLIQQCVREFHFLSAVIFNNFSQLDSMCRNIDRHIAEDKSFNMLYAFRCCALDVICTVCFARTMDATSEPGFNAPYLHAVDAAFPTLMTYKHFPLFKRLAQTLPHGLMLALKPDLEGVIRMRLVCSSQCTQSST